MRYTSIPPGRFLEYPSLPRWVRLRVVQVAKIMNGDDGFGMEDGNDVGRDEQQIRRSQCHLDRESNVRPTARKRNEAQLGTSCYIRRWLRGVEIEPVAMLI